MSANNNCQKNESDMELCAKSDDEGHNKNDENSKTEAVAFRDIDEATEEEELHRKNVIKGMFDNHFALLENRIKFSAQKEYEELLKSNDFIRHKFLVKMPPDFYLFWDFWKEFKSQLTGDNFLTYMEKTFQLKLVGAFEYLAGRFHQAPIGEPGEYLRHWRFFYDPPEFQTLFVRCKTGVHFGYWRDDPQDDENLLIARNDASKSCVFEFIAGNIFDAFLYYIDTELPRNPFNSSVIRDTTKELHKFCTTHNIELNNLDVLQKRRSIKVVTKTFHRLGIVVPYDCKTQVGYRPLKVTENELKEILNMFNEFDNKKSSDKRQEIKETVMEKLQPIATAANIAMDECDFGTPLELGMDLFCSGHVELHKLIQSIILPTYNLLHRPQFLAIIKSHMENRQKNFKLSMFETDPYSEKA